MTKGNAFYISLANPVIDLLHQRKYQVVWKRGKAHTKLKCSVPWKLNTCVVFRFRETWFFPNVKTEQNLNFQSGEPPEWPTNDEDQNGHLPCTLPCILLPAQKSNGRGKLCSGAVIRFKVNLWFLIVRQTKQQKETKQLLLPPRNCNQTFSILLTTLANWCSHPDQGGFSDSGEHRRMSWKGNWRITHQKMNKSFVTQQQQVC